MEKYTSHWEKGMYQCSKCGAELFPSEAKFKSGTQWPSFRAAIPGAIATRPDHSYGMERTEILCAKCGEHLGHVFDEVKEKRFCVLSEALNFQPKQ